MEQPDQVFLRDLERKTTVYASHLATDALGFGGFRDAFVSDDGRFVAFNDRVAGFGLEHNVGFLTDLVEPRAAALLDLSKRVRGPDAVNVRWLSPDGSTAIVSSAMPGLDPEAPHNARMGFYRYDRASGRFRRLTPSALDLTCGEDYPFFAVSGDGQTIALATANPTLVPKDLNGDLDVFTVSLVDGSVELISVAAQP